MSELRHPSNDDISLSTPFSPCYLLLAWNANAVRFFDGSELLLYFALGESRGGRGETTNNEEHHTYIIATGP